MVVMLAWAFPGATLLLLTMAAVEYLRRRRRGGQSGLPMSATYVNEFTAMFQGTKRIELDHRDSQSMMRQQDAQGAPPWLSVDLDDGVVTVRPDGRFS